MKKRKDGRYMRTFTVNGKRICFYSTETTEKKAMKDIERQLLNYQKREEKGKGEGREEEEKKEKEGERREKGKVHFRQSS